MSNSITSSRIFVCGDLHGKHDFDKLRPKKWKEQKELTKEDVLIQLGDFGWIWYDIGVNRDQEYWLNWLAMRPYTMLIVLGNHENYDVIETLPECQLFGGTVQYYESTERFGTGIIFFAKRGEIYTINNKKFFTFGGALSIDKESRTLGTSYWVGEQPNWYEYENAMKKLDAHNWNVDYVLSHTCPVNIIEDLIHRTTFTEGKFKDPVAEFLYEIYKKISFKEWHLAHFHLDTKLDFSETNDGIFYCHYNKIPFELNIKD